jgi:hypothetical protein
MKDGSVKPVHEGDMTMNGLNCAKDGNMKGARPGTWGCKTEGTLSNIDLGVNTKGNPVNVNPTRLGGKVKGNTGKKMKYVSVKPVHEGGKAKDTSFCAKGGKIKVNHY